jgi:hypothetical protein
MVYRFKKKALIPNEELVFIDKILLCLLKIVSIKHYIYIYIYFFFFDMSTQKREWRRENGGFEVVTSASLGVVPTLYLIVIYIYIYI